MPGGVTTRTTSFWGAAVTLEQTTAFLLFALAAAVTPGPSNVMIASTGSAVGFRRGLPCAAGAALGMASLIGAAALGLGHVVTAVPALLTGLKFAGAAFLLWLAAAIWRAGGQVDGQARAASAVEAALFQWLNPKGWLVAASAGGLYLPPGASPFTGASLLAVLFFAAALPSGLVWLGLGAGLKRMLRDPRAARVFNRTMALTLAGSVVLILL
jgi:threonine/homoserine/homoserine lactone efflux protein